MGQLVESGEPQKDSKDIQRLKLRQLVESGNNLGTPQNKSREAWLIDTIAGAVGSLFGGKENMEQMERLKLRLSDELGDNPGTPKNKRVRRASEELSDNPGTPKKSREAWLIDTI